MCVCVVSIQEILNKWKSISCSQIFDVRVSLINIYNPYNQNLYVSIKFHASVPKSIWGGKGRVKVKVTSGWRRATVWDMNICSFTIWEQTNKTLDAWKHPVLHKNFKYDKDGTMNQWKQDFLFVLWCWENNCLDKNNIESLSPFHHT